MSRFYRRPPRRLATVAPAAVQVAVLSYLVACADRYGRPVDSIHHHLNQSGVPATVGQVRHALKRLAEARKVRERGGGRGRRWYVVTAEMLAEEAADEAAYNRRKAWVEPVAAALQRLGIEADELGGNVTLAADDLARILGI